jgi:predicted permease
MLAALYAHDSAGRRVAFDLTLRGVVIATTLVVTALAALCAGAAPALQAGRTDLIGVLKDETASGGSHRARLRALLVSVQVAVSVVLLVGAALMIQSLRHAYQGPGFEPDRLIMLRLRPSLVDYPREASHAFQREIVRALEAVPGVTSASPSVYLSMFSAGERVTVAGPTGTHEPVEALANAVGPRYFRTIGLELVGGREFTDQDRTGAPLAAIVNDILARRLWPAGGGVGSVLMIGAHPHTVIGIVPDAQYYPTGDPPRPQVFFSYWQPHSDDAFLNDSRTFVRVEGEPARLMPAIRRAVATVDPAVPLSEDYPVKDRVAYAFQPVRMARGLLTAFAVLALVLSAVGLYGVLAYSVAQRTREIGVRMALGATRTSIAILVLRDALLATASGAVIGLAAAWSASHLLAGLLFGIESSNVMAYAAGPAVLVLVALFASAIPVRRAANLAPLDAIRTE